MLATKLSRDKITLHPKAGMVAIVASVNAVPIRLTEERWRHILEYYRELAKYLDKILLTVANPDIVFKSPTGLRENIVAVRKFTGLVQDKLAEYLAVHYTELSDKDGFILTVFPISAKRLKKRYRIWRKLR